MARGLARWWVHLEVIGTPPRGPVVIAANHFSHVDPVAVAVAIGRPFRYLAVDELFGRSRGFDALTLWLGAIPTSRTRPPLGALRLALAELAAGRDIGLFPEGVRVWEWGEVPPKRGAAWLALRAGVPLLPVAVAGTDRVMGRGGGGIKRSPVSVVVGEPIDPDDHASADDPVGAMLAEWHRRVDDGLRQADGRRLRYRKHGP